MPLTSLRSVEDDNDNEREKRSWSNFIKNTDLLNIAAKNGNLFIFFLEYWLFTHYVSIVWWFCFVRNSNFDRENYIILSSTSK